MLVLTRKAGEKISIGQGISVTVLKIRGRSVQLGIEAPDGVQILRGELIERLENAATETRSSVSEKSSVVVT